MKQSDKIRVAVLYGGRSAEHEISLHSAANVIEHLDPTRFEVIPIGIDKQGSWFLGKEVFHQSLAHKKVQSGAEHYPTWFTPAWVGQPIEKHQVKELLTQKAGPIFDVVFPVVHGPLCEDGALQGLLELADVAYVGCGVLSSAIGMDKDVSKRLAMHAGVPVAPYLVIKHDQWRMNEEFYLNEVTEKLSYPVFVKPANTGSSVGITKVKSPEQLASALLTAFQYDTKVLIEKGLEVMELEIAILESLQSNTDPIVSVVGEIKTLKHEFYSYDAKYHDDEGVELLIPAPLSNDLKKEAQSVAKKIFNLLECEGMARVDLFYTKDTRQIYFNEINTIPGFTQISMYPKLMHASGFSYSKLLTHLIELALKRHQHKSQLVRSYKD